MENGDMPVDGTMPTEGGDMSEEKTMPTEGGDMPAEGGEEKAA